MTDAVHKAGPQTGFIVVLEQVPANAKFDKEGRELIAPTEIFAVRNINYSPHTVLSFDIQQAQMIKDMRKELAMQITLRLMALGYRK
jgi:outer membrane lipopolysaccharide assembly protein LptE/RlpB